LSHNEILSLNKVGYYHPCEETISDYNSLGKIVWQWGENELLIQRFHKMSAIH